MTVQPVGSMSQLGVGPCQFLIILVLKMAHSLEWITTAKIGVTSDQLYMPCCVGQKIG